MVLDEDTIFIPPVGGVGFGRFEGNYVFKSWYPWGERADLYTFENPSYAAQYIYRLIIHCRIARDDYPYGEARAILKTHGQTYYRGEPEGPGRWPWIHAEFTTNPYTNQPWTREEVQSLQAGVAMDKVGSFGVIVCDQIFIELRYT